MFQRPCRRLALVALTLVAGCTAVDHSEQLGSRAAFIEDDGTIERGEWREYGPYDLGAGGTLRATLAMSNGDADLYVRAGQAPASSAWDCRPYLGGTQTEECDAVGPTTVYVAVAGYDRRTDFELSVEIDDGVPFPAEAQEFDASGALAAGVWRHYGPFNALRGELRATLADPSSGDADLYVRRSEPPTNADYDCRSNGPASTESCALQGPGMFYVSVRGYAMSSSYTLDVAFLANHTTPQPGVNHASGSLEAAEWAYFGPYFHGSGLAQIVLSGSGDADLFVKAGSQPSATSYDCRPFGGDSNEVCQLDLASAGELWIGVNAYGAATSFELVSVYVAD